MFGYHSISMVSNHLLKGHGVSSALRWFFCNVMQLMYTINVWTGMAQLVEHQTPDQQVAGFDPQQDG